MFRSFEGRSKYYVWTGGSFQIKLRMVEIKVQKKVRIKVQKKVQIKVQKKVQTKVQKRGSDKGSKKVQKKTCDYET